MPKVVITMPAYRAESTLARTVADIPPDVADQLILVDDASPDNTARLARELGIDVYVHPKNLGYGGNQKTCYTEALRSGADIIVLLHPDYQYEPKAVPLLIAPILAGDADMTFGSRFAGLGDPIGGGMPLYRFVGNRVTTIIENLMLGSRFSELHSGLRAYTRRSLLSLPFLRYSNDFAFDSELLIDAVTSGQRVVEVPIPTRYTRESSSISISRSLAYIGKTLAYCAARASVRGRRGRRSPVTRARHVPVAGVPVSSGELLPAEQPRLGAGDAQIVVRRLIAAVGGYAVRGRRLLLITGQNEDLREPGRKAGWVTEVAETEAVGGGDASTREHAMQEEGHERYASVDAVAVVDGREIAADPVEALRRLRAVLDPEGVVALGVPSVGGDRLGRGARATLLREPRWQLNPEALASTLRLAGFRMVEWEAPRARRPRFAIAVARPVRSAIPERGVVSATDTDALGAVGRSDER